MKRNYLIAVLITYLAGDSFAYGYHTPYQSVVTASRHAIQRLLKQIQPLRDAGDDTQIAYLIKPLLDQPYLYTKGMGEGDWQPRSPVYQGGALHANPLPVYRMDGFNCQTFVQTVMALYFSLDLASFDQTYLKIAYGAARNSQGDIVRFYNRNHFVDADFNPINQRNGFLKDITSEGPLSEYAKYIQTKITRERWFQFQQNKETTEARPHFNTELITMSYIPKETLAIRQPNGGFAPNQLLLNQIPTPSIAVIIRDPEKWYVHGKPVKDSIGSSLTVSHLGILYREHFSKGDLIYQKTTCLLDDSGEKKCITHPIHCEQATCHELMFAHATDALPAGYYWYQTQSGHFSCTSQKPLPLTPYTSCNRVIALPFFDYLTEYQLGYYWNQDLPSILGVHIEKLGNNIMI